MDCCHSTSLILSLSLSSSSSSSFPLPSARSSFPLGATRIQLPALTLCTCTRRQSKTFQTFENIYREHPHSHALYQGAGDQQKKKKKVERFRWITRSTVNCSRSYLELCCVPLTCHVVFSCQRSLTSHSKEKYSFAVRGMNTRCAESKQQASGGGNAVIISRNVLWIIKGKKMKAGGDGR